MHLVPQNQLANVWPQVAPWIAEAINRREGWGDENLLDVLIALARNTYGLWHEPGEFAAVVQLTQMPRQSVATIVYAGGKIDSLPRLWQESTRWARQNGIDVIRLFGRAGWERLLNLERVGVILQARVSHDGR